MSPGHLMAHFTNSVRTISIDTVFCCRDINSFHLTQEERSCAQFGDGVEP
jgi:hypothetical protein